VVAEKERAAAEKKALKKTKLAAAITGDRAEYTAMLKNAQLAKEAVSKERAASKSAAAASRTKAAASKRGSSPQKVQPGAAGHTQAGDAETGADAELLPTEWRSLPAGFFEQEEDFPPVLLS
jgi:hypothetical protein